ncbi:hypothetical protein FQZ97_1133000 [compost metagenome]
MGHRLKIEQVAVVGDVVRRGTVGQGGSRQHIGQRLAHRQSVGAVHIYFKACGVGERGVAVHGQATIAAGAAGTYAQRAALGVVPLHVGHQTFCHIQGARVAKGVPIGA